MSNQFDTLYHDLHEMGSHSPEYWAKQMHKVPETDTVDRTHFLTERCREKTILHIGCDGPLDIVLRQVAKRVYGIDRERLDRKDFSQCDLDSLQLGNKYSEHALDAELPYWKDIELIVCGEVLEHLSNPGHFVECLKDEYRNIPVIFTVPHAGAILTKDYLTRHYENVNIDHVAWYSYWTLLRLLERYGYHLNEWHWYNGLPFRAEGIIMVVS